MPGAWLFLGAYACSGFAGLVYQVTWTRLLTLYMGHTTAAAATVVAAFMGGLGCGAVVGAQLAPRLTRRQSLITYAGLEASVILLALLLPRELEALVPLLSRAYANGATNLLFPSIRLITCLVLLALPAFALGATFPLAARWFVTSPRHLGRGGGLLYTVNTAGATLGALGAGFFLLPAFGLFGTTLIGVAAGGVAIACALGLASAPDDVGQAREEPPLNIEVTESATEPNQDGQWLVGATVLACSGFGTLMYEIAWTRVFSLTIGPSTYAFAATLTTIIAATACGSAVGSAIAGRFGRPAAPLAVALASAAIASAWATSAAGTLPHFLISDLGRSTLTSTAVLVRNALLGAGVIAPTALALGCAFPLALELAGGRDIAAPRRLGVLYAVNTFAAVVGAMASGFIALPMIGLHDTLRVTSAVLIAATLVVVLFGRLPRAFRLAGLVPAAVAMGMLLWSAPWDRALIASGVYKYAPEGAQTLDPEVRLKAGTLLYDRDGAVATVSVKRLAGVLSLAIDGKVDASTSVDMLTQKLLAHLPLLLHDDPRRVSIIGLGSGVTLASALVHPVESVDVVELSPEVVEASRYFAAQNHDALDDPRTHLINGDGRSHMLLSTRKYDVIVSEPSNPWMAGVAALFTREFFSALRDRLNPGGIVCQWAHTYDISEADLRSVVATFGSVFPQGTMWLVGDGDLLLVASVDSLEPQLTNIERNWRRPGVASDLADVSAAGPFALYSLFVGGPGELGRYGAGATLQTDDRMTLEFSGPHAIYEASTTADNIGAVRALLDSAKTPPIIARALADAGATEWRGRGAMMLQAGANGPAFLDYLTAVRRAPTDPEALDGLVRAAVAIGRAEEVETLLQTLGAEQPRATPIRVALSKMLAASGRYDAAIAAARDACEAAPTDPVPWEHLASILAEAGDGDGLITVVDTLQRMDPTRPAVKYYSAAAGFLRGQFGLALDLAKQAIALDPHNARPLNLLGAVYARLGRSELAKEAFESALRLDPQDAGTYTNLGLQALSLRDPHQAWGFFAEALSIDPQWEAALRGLQEARRQLTR